MKTLIILLLVLIIIGLIFHEKLYYLTQRYILNKSIKLPPKPNVRNLLLISNSREYELGRESYFKHCQHNIKKFLEPLNVKSILLIPYGGAGPVTRDADKYTQIIKEEVCTDLDVTLTSIHTFVNEHDQQAAILNAECIFVSGGNAFKLLDELYKKNLVKPLQKAVSRGIPYIGVSSGVVVANPSLHTSRSMPIIKPVTYRGLDLIPFYINVHYYQALGNRLNQYLLRNPKEKILAITEGVVIHVVGNKGEVVGFGKVELLENRSGDFIRRRLPIGSNISFLLN